MDNGDALSLDTRYLGLPVPDKVLTLDGRCRYPRSRPASPSHVKGKCSIRVSFPSISVPPWATIIVIILLLLTICTCLACFIRRTCRKIWKKKGVKGGKGIDLQAVRAFGLHKEKVK